MKKEKMIWIASVAIGKNLDYETLEYSDYMYDNMDCMDEVWAYVEEAKEQGMEWFRETYSEYKLY